MSASKRTSSSSLLFATELSTGKAVIMKESGDVPFAIRASCAIPGWYLPVVDDEGRQLVDGGLVANIPVNVARSLGADIVIAVDVNAEGAKFLGQSYSIIGVVIQSMLVVQRIAAQAQLDAADFVIAPHVGHIRWDEMGRADELLAAGREAAVESLADIRSLIAEASKSLTAGVAVLIKGSRANRLERVAAALALHKPQGTDGH